MCKRFGFLLFLTLLAGCAATSEEIVPVRQLFAETAGRPFECVNYDAATDSCQTQAYVTAGEKNVAFDIRSRSHFLPRGVTEGGELRLRVVSRIEGSSLCTDLTTTEVTVTDVSVGDAAKIAALHRTNLRNLGSTCTTYLRHAGHYRFVNVTPDGFVVTEGIDRARFFATPRSLR